MFERVLIRLHASVFERPRAAFCCCASPSFIFDCFCDRIRIASTHTHHRLSGPVRDLLAMENVKREVGLRFRRFLSGYKDNRAKLVYLDRIDIMAEENRESLEISYLHLISQVRRRKICGASFDVIFNTLTVTISLSHCHRAISTGFTHCCVAR